MLARLNIVLPAMTGQPGTQGNGDRPRDIVNFIFARDWTAARQWLEATPWLMSDDGQRAVSEMREGLVALIQTSPEPSAASASLLDLAISSLARAAATDPGKALALLEQQDASVERLVDVESWVSLHAALIDVLTQYERASETLLHLLLRALFNQDHERVKRIEQSHAWLVEAKRDGPGRLACKAGEEIARQMLSLPPQHADANTVIQLELASNLLGSQRGSELWGVVQDRLASHLMETTHGNRAANFSKAAEVYRELLANADRSAENERWEVAMAGIANSLANHPQASTEQSHQALAIYDELVPYLRTKRPHSTMLALVLGNQARALQTSSDGDATETLERAIAVQSEGIDTLAAQRDSAEWQPAHWAQAQHNLAGMYLARKLPLRSQNVDRAVQLLGAALAVRTLESDPIGRVKTLRGLAAAYPEWSGAESLEHARDLADAASDEARWIEQHDPIVMRRQTAWTAFTGQVSALDADLSAFESMTSTEHLEELEVKVGNHRCALAALSRESMPLQWAQWLGGLARLLALYPRMGRRDLIDETYSSFDEAIAVLPSGQRGVRLLLVARLGEFCHELGDWRGSHRANAVACSISSEVFDEAGTMESRQLEIAQSRVYALCGAYAAARLGDAPEAVRLAEFGRCRNLVDVVASTEIGLSECSESMRARVAAARARVESLERDVVKLQEADPVAQMAAVAARLGDEFGVDPGMLQMRITNPGPAGLDAAREQWVRLSAELRLARSQLRNALEAARAESPFAFARVFTAGEVRRVAREAGYPLIYLLSTAHGSVALPVTGDAVEEPLWLDDLRSDDTQALLDGRGGGTSYLAGALHGQGAEFEAALDAIAEVVGTRVVLRLKHWLQQRNHDRAALVALGSIGLLPLHTIATSTDVVLSSAPSARVLGRSIAARARRAAGLDSIAAVGVPVREGEAPLRLAVAEVRSICRLYAAGPQTIVLARGEAGAGAVASAAAGARCLHFACHAHFRPSSPLDSALLLRNDERLTLRDVFDGVLDVASADLVYLSACHTGGVAFRELRDEAIGFPAALLAAGVSGCVTTLWPVADVVAMLFAVRFYELYAGESIAPAVAVARSRAWMRTVSAKELRTRVRRVRDALAEEDMDEYDALTDLWRRWLLLEDSAQPLASPRCWAAFSYAGI
jgi:CHAT domain-containing protein